MNSKWALALVLSCPVLTAGPLGVNVVANFTGGPWGSWVFDYQNGPAGYNLRQITIDLSPTDRHFDTAPNNFPYVTDSYQDIGTFNGTDITTGLSAILPGTGSVLNDGSLLTLVFDHFFAGMTFQFVVDVDGPDPARLVLEPCPPNDPLGGYTCALTQTMLVGHYALEVSMANQTFGMQMGSALVTLWFEGPGLEPLTLEGRYGAVDLDVATAQLTSEVIPEPASVGLVLSGIAVMLWLNRPKCRA